MNWGMRLNPQKNLCISLPLSLFKLPFFKTPSQKIIIKGFIIMQLFMVIFWGNYVLLAKLLIDVPLKFCLGVDYGNLC